MNRKIKTIMGMTIFSLILFLSSNVFAFTVTANRHPDIWNDNHMELMPQIGQNGERIFCINRGGTLRFTPNIPNEEIVENFKIGEDYGQGGFWRYSFNNGTL